MGEYRRWSLTHPAKPDKNRSFSFGSPMNCSEYDEARYESQFRRFYFNNADGPYEPKAWVPAKLVSLAVLIGQILYWVVRQQLCVDIAPWLCQAPRLPSRVSLAA